MSERVLISYAGDADPGALTRALDAHAVSVAPLAALPGTLLALVEPDRVDDFIARARALPHVRNVERDRMRDSL